MPRYAMIPVSEIAEPPAPVRASIDEEALIELAESIREVGIVQPLIVIELTRVSGNGHAEGTPSPSARDAARVAGKPVADAQTPRVDTPSASATSPKYEVIAGHRRLLAARYNRMESVPCMVYQDGQLAREAAMLHENVYRSDLTAAEEGAFYAELITKHDLTEEALCKMVRQKPNYIYDRLALVQGDPAVLRACAERTLSFAVARELNKCKNEKQRAVFLDMVLRGGAAASVVRQWVQKVNLESDVAEQVALEGVSETAQAPAPSGALRCAFCGQSHAPFNLRHVMVCFFELDQIAAILAAQGVNVSEAWPKGV